MHDVAAALVDHLRDRELGDVEEPGQIYARDRGVVGERVLRERLTEVDPSVVDERVNPSEPIDRLGDHPPRRFGVSDVPLDDEVAVVG